MFVKCNSTLCAALVLAAFVACGADTVENPERVPSERISKKACRKLMDRQDESRGVVVACETTSLGLATIQVRRSSREGVCFRQGIAGVGGYEECEGPTSDFTVPPGVSVARPVAGTSSGQHFVFGGLTSNRVATLVAEAQPASPTTAVPSMHAVVSPELARRVGLGRPIGRYLVAVPRESRQLNLTALDGHGRELARISVVLRP